jgi:hypothetical protein
MSLLSVVSGGDLSVEREYAGRRPGFSRDALSHIE